MSLQGNQKVLILDEHYFAFSALFTVGLQLSFFAVAYLCKFDLLTDFAAALNKCILAILTLILGGTFYPRQIVLTVMLLLCRAELGLFLLYRVCSRKKDSRFDELRENFFAFLGFWVYQMIWVFATIAPVIFVNGDNLNPAWNALDYIGWASYVVGFVSQVLADYQKFQFRKDASNKGIICQVGIWKYSRHPNYFGEIMIWMGIFIGAIPVIVESSTSGLGWFTIISPLFSIFVLLFLSGIPFAEGKNLKRWYDLPDNGAAWEEYARSTAPLIPMPFRSMYRNFSPIVKKLLCCEFDMYKYNPADAGLIDDSNNASGQAKTNPSYGSGDEGKTQ